MSTCVSLQALVARFIDHTDSIYLRLEVINHYLMRPRLEAQRPELAEQPPAEPYVQLVSLRRYGGLTTSVPRPAAVSAVGGGYLVRVCSPGGSPPMIARTSSTSSSIPATASSTTSTARASGSPTSTW